MTAAKLTKPMRTAIDSAEVCKSSEIKLGRKWVATTVQRITCAPSTYKALARLGLVGPAVERFRLPEYASHGTLYNRQYVQADLVHGPMPR
jgi:hypothetical protein